MEDSTHSFVGMYCAKTLIRQLLQEARPMGLATYGDVFPLWNSQTLSEWQRKVLDSSVWKHKPRLSTFKPLTSLLSHLTSRLLSPSSLLPESNTGISLQSSKSASSPWHLFNFSMWPPSTGPSLQLLRLSILSLQAASSSQPGLNGYSFPSSGIFLTQGLNPWIWVSRRFFTL